MLKRLKIPTKLLKLPAKHLGIIALLAILPFPALAAKRMTVEQLEQTLSAGQLTHRTDEATAQQLVDVKLTARLDSYNLDQLLKTSPGPRTSESLRALADSSAFLDPPPGEVPALPAPDIATQKAIMAQVIHYVAKTLPTLPNFFATRVTEHYYDALPGAVDAGNVQLAGGLLPAGKVETPIAYRDGQESDDPALLRDAVSTTKGKSRDKTRAQDAPAGTGLSSWGEFGPILGVVLVDAAKGKLGWRRWEQHGDKRVAVFQFLVDRAVSHYNVQYCCVQSSEVVNGKYGTSQQRGPEGPTAGLVKATPAAVLRQITGYHGHLDVDPATGTILSITIEADLHPDDNIQRAAIQVEYGPVQIGNSTYVCPTHSVSLSETLESFQRNPTSAIEQTKRLLLNDVQFTGYHRFSSETVMVESASDKGEAAAAAPPGKSEAEPNAANGQPSTSTSSATPSAPASAAPSGAPPATAAVAPSPAPISAAVAAEDEEFLVKEVDGLPGSNTDAATADANAGGGTAANTNESGTFTLKVTTRLVNVSLIATDKHDAAITNLKPEDIEIYDNGRKQQIRSFQHPSAIAKPDSAAAEQPAANTGNYTNTAPQAVSGTDAPDLLILLLDEAHLPFNDLNRARGEVLRYLKATRADSRVALYSISEHGFRVIQDITTDHALLQSRLASWMPSASAVSQAQTLDRRDRQQFDTVHTVQDLGSVNGNNQDSPEAVTSIDPELRQMGDNPLRSALIAMVGLARHFASVPGHKSLAWISGDSVLADWEDRQVRTEKGNKYNEAALVHTMEALNEAHISLYAVDASPSTAGGGGAVSAELGNASVQLDPTATANSAPGGAGGPHGAAIGAARVTADMQQNTRAIQGPVRQLAEATGGLAINKGGDLKVVLDGIDRHANALYELGFDPDTAADNKFHTLVVKVPGRRDLKLHYRTGYLYNEEAVSTKERFQQAIWSPQDLNGVGISAETVAAADSPSGKSGVKLRITFAGLDLQQKESRWTDQLYIYVAERDDATQKAQVTGETLRLSLKQGTYDSGIPAGIPYQRSIEPKFKQGSVRVIVVDANSGNLGSVTIPASELHP